MHRNSTTATIIVVVVVVSVDVVVAEEEVVEKEAVEEHTAVLRIATDVPATTVETLGISSHSVGFASRMSRTAA